MIPLQIPLQGLPAILMSFTCHCWVNISNHNHWRLAISEEDKVFIEVMRPETVIWGEKVYQRVYEQKLFSVVCEEVADED